MDGPLLTVTQNGLRVLAIEVPSAPVEYCGVIINTGSRDELPGEEGLSHFIEHTIFKGTGSHKASYIAARMEEVGGELNAYTTKEETVVYSILPHGYLSRAINLIAEIVIDSQFPENEIDKEREVIREEILSYRDSPSEAIYDDFDELIFRHSPLAHNILGTEESINRFTSTICRDHLTRFYTAPNMLFFYMGATPCEKLLRYVDTAFASLPRNEAPLRRIKPEPVQPRKKEIATDTHQEHTIIGSPVPGMFSPTRHIYALLNNILGGPGMNSMLNVALREKRGLVYSVESSTALYTDCGLLTVYYGCDPEDNRKCLRLVENVLHRLAEKPLSQNALLKAQRQYLGQLVVARDNREQVILGAARSAIYYGSVLTPQEVTKRIESVTSEDLRKAAESLLGFSVLTIR
ncbi:MAG: insulinase family protein [Muribaculaceae bacterium]|nr:insulinase family protein [Muribaculaceae bacterium]